MTPARRPAAAPPTAADLRHALYREIAEVAGDWLWEFDAAYRFTFATPRFAEAIGLPPPAFLGRRFDELPGLRISGGGRMQLHDAMAARRSFSELVFRVDLGPGNVRFWRASGKPFDDGKGAFAGYRVCVAEVTDTVEREIRLNMALSRAEAADQQASYDRAILLESMDIMPAGFALWNADDRLELCNARYREIYALGADLMVRGVPFAEALCGCVERGIFVLDGVDPETWIKNRLVRRQLARDGIEGSGVFEQRFADGRFIEVDERRTADGGIVGTRIDVTERRKREASDAERQKLTALGQLAGGVAHEINNLLQPALMLPEIIAERPGIDAASRQDLATIHDGARKARDIVKSILLYSRKQEQAMSVLASVPALATALKFVRGLLPPTVIIEEIIPEALGALTILANETQLAQVVTNLVINAAQAMNDRGTVTVSVERHELARSDAAELGLIAGRPYLVVAVRDSGPGMDAATLARIFEPFFTTKPQGQGTGLGLSVVYGIVKSWNGAIAATSAPGEGAVFRLYLPLHSAA